jgi:hypothetical protein
MGADSLCAMGYERGLVREGWVCGFGIRVGRVSWAAWARVHGWGPWVDGEPGDRTHRHRLPARSGGTGLGVTTSATVYNGSGTQTFPGISTAYSFGSLAAPTAGNGYAWTVTLTAVNLVGSVTAVTTVYAPPTALVPTPPVQFNVTFGEEYKLVSTNAVGI